MAKASDRRKRVRIPVQSKIRHSRYQVLGTPVFQENSSIDLSLNGISFETSREYQIGNLVLLEVEIEDQPLKLLVCVAWVKPSDKEKTYQVGAELIAVDPVHKRKMQNHLNRLISAVQAKRKSATRVVRQKKKTRKKTPAKALARKKSKVKARSKKLPSKK